MDAHVDFRLFYGNVVYYLTAVGVVVSFISQCCHVVSCIDACNVENRLSVVDVGVE